MSGIKKFLIVFVFILSFFCSNQEKNSSQDVSELDFDVDSTKLEPTIQNKDLCIQFSSPKGWTLISQDIFEEFSKRNQIAHIENSGFSFKPISIFLNQESESLLYVSLIHGLEDTSTAKLIEKYKGVIITNFTPFKSGDFLKDNILFVQFLIQDEERVNFKLLFINNKNQLIQFDYIIPNKSYLSELKAIESSIGSIQLIG